MMSANWEIFGLKDKVAIVSGPSQGIGQALAVALARAGAHVALVSRNQSALEAVAKEVEALDRKALVIPTDLTDISQLNKMVDQVHKTFGSIDILINNAAWTPTIEALEVTEEQWDQAIATSLKAVFFLSQAVARIMIPQGGGKIINMGSTLGEVSFAGRSVYAAAKAGVHHLTRALSYEWASKGVNVNAVGPCITETPTRREIFERPGYKEWECFRSGAGPSRKISSARRFFCAVRYPTWLSDTF
jgi:2-deoxy-D-gluconate 3-dehydrogenase